MGHDKALYKCTDTLLYFLDRASQSVNGSYNRDNRDPPPPGGLPESIATTEPSRLPVEFRTDKLVILL